MKKILVIGSINIDLAVKIDHIPLVGETILSDTIEYVPGGKGANQAFAVGKLGGNVSMLGAVGNDQYADILLNSLKSAGVDTNAIVKKSDYSTGMAFILVNAEGNNSIVVVSGANKSITPHDIEQHKHLIDACDILLCQLEIPLDSVLAAIKYAKSKEKLVVLDPAPAPKNFPDDLLTFSDIITPNETELAQLTGKNTDEYEEATDILRKKGVKSVIVTLGKDGVFINSAQDGKQYFKAVPAPVVDTTAAGDSFTAALVVQLAQNVSLVNAVNYANHVAAIVVSRKGAQPSIPSANEVLFDNY